MFCPKCGHQNDERALYCQSCGNLFRETTAPAATPALSVDVTAYAGFWLRVAAAIIDACVISIGSVILWIITFGSVPIGIIPIGWLYEALMTSSEWQATLGKRVMSIVVTGVNGGRITFLRATARHFAKYISAFLLFIGYIMVAFTPKKQALHDMIAETLVIKK